VNEDAGAKPQRARAGPGAKPGAKKDAAKGGPKDDEPKGALAFLKTRHDPLTSVVLVIPVFLLYHLGILAIDVRNGVDYFTEATLALLDRNVWAYLGVTLLIAGGLFGAAWYLRKREKIKPASLLPIVLESLVWAIVMTFLVGWATQKLTSIQLGPHRMNAFEKLIMSAGAGLHEEIVFRVALFAGGTFALERIAKWKAWQAALVAGVASSLVFSAIHYIGPLSDPFSVASFVFRTLAGGYLAAIYRFRGFAVAVYTHALYDVLVFFVL
jgi:hypothetical protein